MNEETMETTQEITPEAADHARKVKEEMWQFIFSKLTESKRFLEFVDNNYDIIQELNDEEKTITVKVIEKPIAVGPQMTAKQIAKLHQIIVKSGTEKVGETMKSLLETLGQDDSGVILAGDFDPSQLKAPQ